MLSASFTGVLQRGDTRVKLIFPRHGSIVQKRLEAFPVDSRHRVAPVPQVGG